MCDVRVWDEVSRVRTKYTKTERGARTKGVGCAMDCVEAIYAIRMDGGVDGCDCVTCCGTPGITCFCRF